MSELAYDCLIAGRAALILLGVFLISLAVLDIMSWLMARLLAAMSSSVGRAAQVRSALAAVNERRK